MKKLLSLVLAVVMVLGLVACGGGNTPETTAPVEAPEETGGNKGVGALVAILTVLVLVGAGMFFYMKKTYGAEAMSHFKKMCGKAWAAVKNGCGAVVNGIKTKTAQTKAAAEAKKAAKAEVAAEEAEVAVEAVAEEAPAQEEIPVVEVVED